MAAAPITIVALSLIVGGMGLAGVSWQDLKERVKSASGRSRGERGDDYASTADDAGESNANADAERKNAERKNAERMNAERKNADRNAERRANAERKNAERKNADNGKADNAKAANADADKGRNAEPDDADRQDRKPFVPYPAPVGAKRQEVDPMGPPKFEPSGQEMGKEVGEEMNALGMRNNVGMGDGGTDNDNVEERGEGRSF